MKKTAQIVFTIIIYQMLMLLIMILVWQSGIYPSGSNVMYHLYRGDYVYHSVLKGDWWPLFDPMWYNGVELMRYWSPAAAYMLAFCEWLMSGKLFLGWKKQCSKGVLLGMESAPTPFRGLQAIRSGRRWTNYGKRLLWPAVQGIILALFNFRATSWNRRRQCCQRGLRSGRC